jgi:hypothetical protein
MKEDAVRAMNRHKLVCLITLAFSSGQRRKSVMPEFAGALERHLPNHSWMQATRPGIRNHRE